MNHLSDLELGPLSSSKEAPPIRVLLNWFHLCLPAYSYGLTAWNLLLKTKQFLSKEREKETLLSRAKAN